MHGRVLPHHPDRPGSGPDTVMPKEHHVYPNQTYEVTRQAMAERLTLSHQARVREASRHDRQPTENIGRPPDPLRVQARPTNPVGVLVAR